LVLVGLAIFAANNRRKAVGAVGVVLVVLASCMLLVFRLGSEHFLANIEQSVYRDAAATVYEAFYGNMRARLITMMVVGILVWALSLVFGPYGWAVRFREMLHIQKSARYHHRSTHH